MDKYTIYVKAKHTLSNKCSDLPINTQTIITVLKYAMEIVEITTIKGHEQKKMVLDLVKAIIKDSSNISDEQRAHLEVMCNEYGPLSNTIDLVIAGTKGELDINIALQTAASCTNSCIIL